MRKAQKQPIPTPASVRLMDTVTWLLLSGFGLAALWAGAFWVAHIPLFALSGITVTGDVQHTNAVTLSANVRSKLSGSFFTIDLQHSKKVFEQLPWVRRVLVEREFPNRLRVHIEAHQPAAFWGKTEELRLLNTWGEIFEANLDELEDQNLPTLIGPDNQSELVLKAYQALHPPMKQLGLDLAQVELSPRGSWKVRSKRGATIELGRGNVDEVLQRFNRFAQTLPEASQRWGRHQSAIESADLRHTNGYALRLNGVRTVESTRSANH